MKLHDFGEMIEGVEILRTGTHTSNSGEKVTFGNADLQALAERYDAGLHEAPLVIGHPKENGPAYGWVKKLRVVGDRLVADCDCAPELVEAIRQGRYRKRSASIYKDLDGKGAYLRHVGLLGAAPPAVKGLADIALGDGGDEAMTIDMEENQHMSWKEKVKSLFGQAVDEIPETGTPAPEKTPATAARPVASFSEAEVKLREEAAARIAAEKAKVAALAEFNEKLERDKAALLVTQRRDSAKARLDALVASGRLTPAEVKCGLNDLCGMLAELDSRTIDLAEGRKASPLDCFVSFMEMQPVKIDTGETASGATDPGRGGASEKISILVAERRLKNPEEPWSTSFNEVQREHPDLAAEYAQEIQG